MTAIKVSCSHQTKYLPENLFTVEEVKGWVCEDALVYEVDFTAVRRAECVDNDGPTLIHLFLSDDMVGEEHVFMLTRNGEVIDSERAPLSQLDTFWASVEQQLEEVKIERTFLEVLHKALGGEI